MNIVKQGNIFRIFDNEDFEVSEKLPVGNYTLCFNRFSGLFLTKNTNIPNFNNNLYGNIRRRVDKVIRSFARTDTNMGILCCGQKGSGKTLFARLLSSTISIPTIVVNEPLPGFVDFLANLNQEVLVLFDEFDKTFSAEKHDDLKSPQDELLTLLDGTIDGKKLFCFTANNSNRINEYMINRPGRIRYNFLFSTLNSVEIMEFLDGEAQDLIAQEEKEQICMLGAQVDITYDSLRALVDELIAGESLKDTLEDLNIIVERPNRQMSGTLSTNIGTFKMENHIDFSREQFTFWFYSCSVPGLKEETSIGCTFSPLDLRFNVDDNSFYLPVDKMTLTLDPDDFDSDEECKHYKQLIKLNKVRFTRSTSYSFRKALMV